jgi:hypothetical protein
MTNEFNDLKPRLQAAILHWDWGTISAGVGYAAKMLCQDALKEIERNAETIRTLQLELDIARSAVRSQSPEVVQLTRHTITLQRPIPALEVGDSILLIVAPTR